MSKEHYSKIKSIMHTYSHAPIANGQEFIDQAVARAGHHVNANEIRSDEFPIISSIDERDQYFLTIDNEGNRIVGGDGGKNFTKVIKFLDKVSLQEIPNTNGETFRIIDKDGSLVFNFIDPADKPINDVKLSDGYEIRLFAEDGETLISRNYGWDFDAFNGLLHFDSSFNPSSIEWNKLNFGKPVLEGFIYIGKNVNDNFDDLKNESKKIKNDLNQVIENAIAVQPFKFSTKEMFKIGESYKNQYNHLDGDQESFQQLSFIVPGYCFELTSLDNDQTFLTELRHLQDGNTQIFLDLPWNIEYDQPVLYYEWSSGIEGVGIKTPVIGKYHFIATTFVKSNGKKISVKNIIDYESNDFEILYPSNDNQYIIDYEGGWPVPDKTCNNVNYMQNDDNRNINVNINN